MPYTLEDYRKDSARRLLNSLTPEERLAGLGAEERLAGLTLEEVVTLYEPEERLAGLTAKEILSTFTPEELLATLTVKDLLSMLTREEILSALIELSGLAPEERLVGLSAKHREWLAKLLLSEQDGGSSIS